MDVVSIYICPLGAALAGVMFFWVLGKEKALAAVNEGAKKPIGSWFFPLGKWVYVICAVLALILGVMYGASANPSSRHRSFKRRSWSL